MQRLCPLLPDILKLWDEIHANWQDWYNEGRAEEAGIWGRFGNLTAGIVDSETRLYFAGGKSSYRMPEAYKYPILGALRAAVHIPKKGSPASWRANPFEILADAGSR